MDHPISESKIQPKDFVSFVEAGKVHTGTVTKVIPNRDIQRVNGYTITWIYELENIKPTVRGESSGYAADNVVKLLKSYTDTIAETLREAKDL